MDVWYEAYRLQRVLIWIEQSCQSLFVSVFFFFFFWCWRLVSSVSLSLREMTGGVGAIIFVKVHRVAECPQRKKIYLPSASQGDKRVDWQGAESRKTSFWSCVLTSHSSSCLLNPSRFTLPIQTKVMGQILLFTELPTHPHTSLPANSRDSHITLKITYFDVYEHTWINQTLRLSFWQAVRSKVDRRVQEARKLPTTDVWPSVLCPRDRWTDITERWNVAFEARFQSSGSDRTLAKKLKRSTSLCMHQV